MNAGNTEGCSREEGSCDAVSASAVKSILKLWWCKADY